MSSTSPVLTSSSSPTTTQFSPLSDTAALSRSIISREGSSDFVRAASIDSSISVSAASTTVTTVADSAAAIVMANALSPVDQEQVMIVKF